MPLRALPQAPDSPTVPPCLAVLRAQGQDNSLQGKASLSIHLSPHQTPKEKPAAQAESGGCGKGSQRTLHLCECPPHPLRGFPWPEGWEESPGGRKLCSSFSNSAHVQMNSVPFKNQPSCNFWDPWDFCRLG